MKKLAWVFRVSLLLLCCVTLLRTTDALAVGPDNLLKLIPIPKDIRLQSGSFHVKPSTRILVEFGHQEEDRIAAETLADEIRNQAGFEVAINGEKPGTRHEKREDQRNIVLARLQDRRVRDFLSAKGLKADSIGDQGYLLFSDRSHVIVAANTGQGLFYGVQTLRQLLRPEGRYLICPAVSIRDWPSLEWGGAQDDISRSGETIESGTGQMVALAFHNSVSSHTAREASRSAF
jgi:hexosaminidase